MTPFERLVWTAQERERVYAARRAGLPRPWTSDPVLASGRFCNVWREQDKTSALILGILRRHRAAVRPALAVGLRLINRHATLLDFRHGEPLRAELGRLLIVGINTNAYRINTPLGLNNKAGVGVLLDRAQERHEELARVCREATSFWALQDAVQPLLGLGSFIVYQALLDLRDLGILKAEDDWAYPGPGAARGLARLEGTWQEAHWSDKSNRLANYGSRNFEAGLCAKLLELTPRLREATGWERWSVHETEGWLCEWDKYERLRARMAVLGS